MAEKAHQQLSPADYSAVMSSFIQTHSERDLYRASSLSHVCIENGLGPEDMVALHFEALEKILPTFSYREHARLIGEAHQFLLEVMISYGVRYKEYLELKLAETVRDAESRAAREHERALELERLQQEKGDILATISHELRNPLTAARGHVDLAAASLDEGSPARRHLGSAREALDRLSRLTADLVEASRGQMPPLDMAPVDLCRTISQAGTWAKPAAENKGLTFTTEALVGEALVRGNADALLSVLGNLFSNSIRYTVAGGSVYVRVGGGNEHVWVEVEDTGIGMSPEVQARIFERFYRGPEARRVEARGLGLGLALVLQVVEAHNGTIEVTSAPDKGSTFRLNFPRFRPADSQDQANTPAD